MQDREEWLADTLVGLADTLVADFDVIEFLSTLTERLVELLGAAEVGLVLADSQGNLRVMAASTERMRMLDLFEVQTNEGPCLDGYRSGTTILNVGLESALARWPVFAAGPELAGDHRAGQGRGRRADPARRTRRSDDRQRLAGDRQLLVRRHHEDRHGRAAG